ncbi:hypothetical protein [Halorubrum lipolyticum]|uniref:Uncharacterized protein n=1 Tax=Halorubrum lipolyticum DSM 21995 TaxID=1227482 RepID=M0P4F7_9EURY|nr:hypothetical protein [Halorubrum lipolyticum]EMA64434.1 hypothetical protein C469_00866 [Halorubrum lipolyticum DSM 21995]
MSPANETLLPSRRALGTGLLAGLAHLAVAGALAEWFGFSIGVTPFLGYVALGGLSLGAVPVAVLVETRLVAPSIVVGVAFVASAYGTWSVYVAPVATPTPVDPTPFGWYLIGWVAVLGAALVAGGAEYGVRRVANARRE